jgi:hypothetical protein
MPYPQRKPAPSAPLDQSAAQLRDAIRAKLTYGLGKQPDMASDSDCYKAMTVRLASQDSTLLFRCIG